MPNSFYVWHWIDNVFVGSLDFSTRQGASEYIGKMQRWLAPLPLISQCDFDIAEKKAPHHQKRIPSPCLCTLRG